MRGGQSRCLIPKARQRPLPDPRPGCVTPTPPAWPGEPDSMNISANLYFRKPSATALSPPRGRAGPAAPPAARPTPFYARVADPRARRHLSSKFPRAREVRALHQSAFPLSRLWALPFFSSLGSTFTRRRGRPPRRHNNSIICSGRSLALARQADSPTATPLHARPGRAHSTNPRHTTQNCSRRSFNGFPPHTCDRRSSFFLSSTHYLLLASPAPNCTASCQE